MNGMHDLGGMDGFGAVDRIPGEAVFQHEWERRAFALTLAMGARAQWNLDMSRYAREQMSPSHYLLSSYYEHWLHGLEHLMIERGLVSAAEISAREAELCSSLPHDAA
jgi:nitrile hydratase